MFQTIRKIFKRLSGSGVGSGDMAPPPPKKPNVHPAQASPPPTRRSPRNHVRSAPVASSTPIPQSQSDINANANISVRKKAKPVGRSIHGIHPIAIPAPAAAASSTAASTAPRSNQRQRSQERERERDDIAPSPSPIRNNQSQGQGQEEPTIRQVVAEDESPGVVFVRSPLRQRQSQIAGTGTGGGSCSVSSDILQQLVDAERILYGQESNADNDFNFNDNDRNSNSSFHSYILQDEMHVQMNRARHRREEQRQQNSPTNTNASSSSSMSFFSAVSGSGGGINDHDEDDDNTDSPATDAEANLLMETCNIVPGQLRPRVTKVKGEYNYETLKSLKKQLVRRMESERSQGLHPQGILPEQKFTYGIVTRVHPPNQRFYNSYFVDISDKSKRGMRLRICVSQQSRIIGPNITLGQVIRVHRATVQVERDPITGENKVFLSTTPHWNYTLFEYIQDETNSVTVRYHTCAKSITLTEDDKTRVTDLLDLAREKRNDPTWFN